MNKRRTEKPSLQCADIILIGFVVQTFYIIGFVPHFLVFIHVANAIILQIIHYFKKFVPPFFPLSFQFSFAFYGYVFSIHGINQRRKTFHHNAFVAHFNKRQKIIEIIREKQSSACFHKKSDVAFQFYSTCKISSRGEKQSSATIGI